MNICENTYVWSQACEYFIGNDNLDTRIILKQFLGNFTFETNRNQFHFFVRKQSDNSIHVVSTEFGYKTQPLDFIGEDIHISVIILKKDKLIILVNYILTKINYIADFNIHSFYTIIDFIVKDSQPFIYSPEVHVIVDYISIHAPLSLSQLCSKIIPIDYIGNQLWYKNYHGIIVEQNLFYQAFTEISYRYIYKLNQNRIEKNVCDAVDTFLKNIPVGQVIGLAVQRNNTVQYG